MLVPLFILVILGVVAAVKNPIIPGWNPDPHILRVEGEYFIATSTFEFFPGTPIYRSTDLAHWELYSHGAKKASQLQLYGVTGSSGAWAPSLSHINGTFYLALMSWWVLDPVASVWPRIFFLSSKDLIDWSDPVWCDPWGIDPHLFGDPISGRTYLTLMSVSNDIDRIWGIHQCEVSLVTGKCVGEYRSLWNGTLEHDSSARPEGPKMFYKDGWYYLLIAEGGTSQNHRATIARSTSPEGPWDAAPNNPLLYNGKYDNLTVSATGHAMFTDTPDGHWFASFLATRKVNGDTPLGRETFLAAVTWEDGWPTVNGGNPILLSEEIPGTPEAETLPDSWTDNFDGDAIDLSWSQLRTPYTTDFFVGCGPRGSQGENYPSWSEGYGVSGYENCSSNGLTLIPNVYNLDNRNTPAAVLRKQKSFNMTFLAVPFISEGQMGPRQSVGISAYLSEFQHQDIGLRGCTNETGLCIYYVLNMGDNVATEEFAFGSSQMPDGLTLQIRAEPLQYSLGYSTANSSTEWLTAVAASWMSYHPSGYGVFTGSNFALYSSGEGEPWPVDGPVVGFKKVTEEYYEENIPDYDTW